MELAEKFREFAVDKMITELVAEARQDGEASCIMELHGEEWEVIVRAQRKGEAR